MTALFLPRKKSLSLKIARRAIVSGCKRRTLECPGRGLHEMTGDVQRQKPPPATRRTHSRSLAARLAQRCDTKAGPRRTGETTVLERPARMTSRRTSSSRWACSWKDGSASRAEFKILLKRDGRAQRAASRRIDASPNYEALAARHAGVDDRRVINADSRSCPSRAASRERPLRQRGGDLPARPGLWTSCPSRCRVVRRVHAGEAEAQARGATRLSATSGRGRVITLSGKRGRAAPRWTTRCAPSRATSGGARSPRRPHAFLSVPSPDVPNLDLVDLRRLSRSSRRAVRGLSPRTEPEPEKPEEPGARGVQRLDRDHALFLAVCRATIADPQQASPSSGGSSRRWARADPRRRAARRASVSFCGWAKRATANRTTACYKGEEARQAHSPRQCGDDERARRRPQPHEHPAARARQSRFSSGSVRLVSRRLRPKAPSRRRARRRATARTVFVRSTRKYSGRHGGREHGEADACRAPAGVPDGAPEDPKRRLRGRHPSIRRALRRRERPRRRRGLADDQLRVPGQRQPWFVPQQAQEASCIVSPFGCAGTASNPRRGRCLSSARRTASRGPGTSP